MIGRVYRDKNGELWRCAIAPVPRAAVRNILLERVTPVIEYTPQGYGWMPYGQYEPTTEQRRIVVPAQKLRTMRRVYPPQLDFSPQAQIKAALAYIRERYGSPAW